MKLTALVKNGSVVANAVRRSTPGAIFIICAAKNLVLKLKAVVFKGRTTMRKPPALDSFKLHFEDIRGDFRKNFRRPRRRK